MNQIILRITLFSIAIAVIGCKEHKKPNLLYPESRIDNSVFDIYFGDTIYDKYRWLENDTSAETADWVKRQNEFTFNYLDSIPHREQIKNRLTEIWNFEKFTAPFFKSGKYFFYKNNGIQNQSVLYYQDGLTGTPKVLLDPNTLSKDGTTALSGLDVRDDAKYAAIMLSVAGSDWKEIKVMDIASGQWLNDRIEWVKFSGVSWFKDGFFYSRFDTPEKGNELSQKNQFHKLYYHRLGDNQNNDKLIYEDKEHPLHSFYADVLDDGKYLILYTSESTSGNNVKIKNLESENSGFSQITTGFHSDYTVIGVDKENLLILTNNGAPKYRVISVNAQRPDSSNWQEIIKEKDAVLQTVIRAKDKLVCIYLKDVSSHLITCSLMGADSHYVALPSKGIIDDISGSTKDSLCFVSFTNYTTPLTVYKMNISTQIIQEHKKPQLAFNTSDYITTQVFYPSKDGSKIPMYITYKKGIKLNGNNPTFLYAYGGFNVSILPNFNAERMVFLENGGVFAVPNLRGGGEYGKEWHESGTKLNKQNVFDDFIAAAEFLIQEKYTNKDKLAIHGRSNGGLLIGAVMTQRPDLFKVALPKVGVLDMLRYHKFTIGYAWATDYGSSDDSIHYRNLIKYSPLHNVREISYPATMILTADHDDRVVPAHSFKFGAELQAKQKSENPVLIRIDTNAGHGAGKPVSKQIEEFADTWSFVFYQLGMDFKR